MAEPHSYCLAITHDSAHVVPLGDRASIESSVLGYLKTLKTKGSSKSQARELYTALLKDIPEVAKKDRIIIVPDGGLHLLPFDALVDDTGRYLVFSHTITYATSASALYLANSVKHPPTQQTFLGIGGIPYEQNAELTKIATLRGYVSGPLVNLPASKDEILAAQATTQSDGQSTLIDTSATKSAFEHSDLADHAIIHLAVHGVANEKHPERAALLLLSDTTALYLMKRFYAHLAERNTIAWALTAAKRDMLRNYGAQAVPYYWASFKLEGAGNQPVIITKPRTTN